MSTALTPYQALEHTSAQMVTAARQGRWSEVDRLQAVARTQVATVRAIESFSRNAPTPAERLARLEALKAILRLDAQVRNLAEPGWVQVNEWLSPSIHRQVAAYSADTDSTY